MIHAKQSLCTIGAVADVVPKALKMQSFVDAFPLKEEVRVGHIEWPHPYSNSLVFSLPHSLPSAK